MKYSNLFGKTSKTAPHDADSVNARLLVQAGYIDQLMAGVYTFLPLGLRALDKVKTIIREEMNGVGGQEVYMPALHPKENWVTTGRWDDPGTEVMFRVQGRGDKEFGLGWTHEEVVTPLAKRFVHSYKDLPVAVYQIQDKFRNEARAKSGLLRGREFSMKDLYSFHADVEDLERYYEEVSEAYMRIFGRCGLDAFVTEASGGAFSKYSHEYQVLTENGEDIIFYCGSCKYAQNREISEYKEGDTCPKCGDTMKEGKAIEVGNIFQLKTKFTEAFDVTYLDKDGNAQPVLMGCYGIGPSRVLGSIVEVHNDKDGIRWPKSIAPYLVHLTALTSKDEGVTGRVIGECEQLEKDFGAAGIDVLYDDRTDKRAGEKFADADLIGLPVRLVVSEKTLAEGAVEWKERSSDETKMVLLGDIITVLQEYRDA